MAKAKSYRTSIPLDTSPNPADYNKDGKVTAAELKRYKAEQKTKRKVDRIASKTEQKKKKGEQKVSNVGKDKDKLGKTKKVLEAVGTAAGILGTIGTTAQMIKKNR